MVFYLGAASVGDLRRRHRRRAGDRRRGARRAAHDPRRRARRGVPHRARRGCCGRSAISRPSSSPPSRSSSCSPSPAASSACSRARGRRHERAAARGRESRQALRRPRPPCSDISFSIAPGEILGLIGPNGSGKSTVMKPILGVERPTAARCSIDGVEVAGWPPHKIARLGVGMVFQHSRPLHRQTVLENIAARRCCPIGCSICCPTPRSSGARDEIAERVGLGARARPPAGDAAVRRSAPHRDSPRRSRAIPRWCWSTSPSPASPRARPRPSPS